MQIELPIIVLRWGLLMVIYTSFCMSVANVDDDFAVHVRIVLGRGGCSQARKITNLKKKGRY